jgi:predicted nicotinamide N-methyase
VERGFFDRFPRFYDTSETSSYPWRLNLRHEAIVGEHAGLLDGARVLDIASHDGRWSLAALEAGAASVVGIEARPELVENARANLAAYDFDGSRYEFVAGDVFDVLAREQPQVDVVLCLGFLYHTLRHNELFTRIRQTGARHVLLDTEVHRSPEAVVRLADEHVTREGNAVADEFSYGDTVLTGRPTLTALELLARTQGFAVERLSDWDGLLRDNPEADHVRDYRIGRRATLLLSSASRSR